MAVLSKLGGVRGWTRVAGVGAACAVSLAAGLVLVFKLVTPEAVTHVGTIELAGLLALLVMPAVVGVCVRAMGMPATSEPAADEQTESGVREIVVMSADVRDLTARRHRRRVAGRARVLSGRAG